MLLEEFFNFLVNGNSEILAFVLMFLLFVVPLILIWRSTYVADRPFSNLQSSNVVGQQNTGAQTSSQTTPTPAAGTSNNDPTENLDAEEIDPVITSAVNDIAAGSPSPTFSRIGNEQVTTSQPPPTVENEEEPENIQHAQSSTIPDLLPDHCYVKLKFLDETVQVVQAKPSDTVGEFRRKNFSSSLEDRYRLIFKGNVLRNNNQTMRDCGIIPLEGGDTTVQMPVVHCFLAPPASRQRSNSSLQAHASIEDLSVGHFFLPLLGCILGMLWYFCINYTSLFTIPSLFGIIGLTGFFLVLVVNRFL